MAKVFDAVVVAVEFWRLTVVVDAVPIAIFVAVVGKTVGIAVIAGAIENFTVQLLEDERRCAKAQAELAGKVLGCWC